MSLKPSKIRAVVISAREKTEYEQVTKQIHECDPTISCVDFTEILHSPEVLRDKIDLILTIGGDGSVAW